MNSIVLKNILNACFIIKFYSMCLDECKKMRPLIENSIAELEK